MTQLNEGFKKKKNSKFAKNEVKAVKVAVSAELRDVFAAPCDMLATQDTHGNSRGLRDPQGGVLSI